MQCNQVVELIGWEERRCDDLEQLEFDLVQVAAPRTQNPKWLSSTISSELLSAGTLWENTGNQARHGDMTATQLVTVEELLQMGSDAPYELWEGVLKEVSPSSFKTDVIALRIGSVVLTHVDDNQLGFATASSGGYMLSTDPATVVAPDAGFVRGDRFPNGIPARGFSPVPPDLAVEVISPTDRKADIAEKQALYTKARVPLVWWVDPERRTVTVHRLGQAPETVEATGVLDGGGVLPGFTLELGTIFRD